MLYVVINFLTRLVRKDSIPIAVKDVRSERLRRVIYFKIVKHGSWETLDKKLTWKFVLDRLWFLSFEDIYSWFVFKNMFVFIIKDPHFLPGGIFLDHWMQAELIYGHIIYLEFTWPTDLVIYKF
jgi:hypothetical protein